MKTILSILIISVLVFSCDQKIPTQAVYEIKPPSMEGLGTKRDSVHPLKISRNSIQDSIIVLFPSGGTETEVVLYRQVDYEKWQSGPIDKRPRILRTAHKTVNDSIEDGLRIDMTSLPDGNYLGEWITCDFGGCAIIELRTKK